ncbi:MAG: hypothetical protein H6649_07795 [Caldilineae bacterium]|nr:hypothetical protein [Anaerolineae bacterium]MCB0254607.1 hypothetical protein [Anaerolineae bacterium]MCB9153942.1 hypothetical protein [Caldilineae bacterium]
MREIRTFVLRLVADTEDPEALRGVLCPVADDKQHPFADEQTLLLLLRRVSRMFEGEKESKSC